MDELIRQIVDILRGMWRRRWIGLAVAWGVALVGAIGVSRVPDRFEASARIYVDTATLLQPLLSGLAIEPDINQQISMMARTLVTRPNIEKLIRDAKLDAGGPAQAEVLIEEIMRELRFSASGRDNVYNVSYRSNSREQSQLVVEQLVTMFVQSGQGNKKRDTESARKFIDDQIAAYEKRLEEAENRLKEFRLRNLSITGGAQDFVARSQAAAEELSRTQVELRVAEQSRDALRRELSGEEPQLASPDASAPGPRVAATAEIDARIDGQRRALDDLLRRYTEQHPEVVQTRRLLTSLEEQRRQELDAMRRAASSAPGRSPAATNPVFQRIRIALSEAEANVAALRARVGEQQARVDQLRAQATRVPQIEAELAQLNRDYEVVRQSYQQLVARRESAVLTGEVDEATGMAEFRIIDPPRVGDRPVFPNRMMLVALVIVAALGAGGGVAFVVSQLMPTFHGVRALREVGGRPVLGGVSLRPNAAMLRRARYDAIGFLGGIGLLVGAYVVWLGWLAIAAGR